MNTEVNNHLEIWVRDTLGKDILFSLNTPSAVPQKESINLYLLDINPGLEARGAGLPPLKLNLHYLVSAWDKETVKMHENLSSLAFSVLENKEWRIVERENLSSIWKDFGLPPRPSFIIEVPCRLKRTRKVAPPVTEPPILNNTPLEPLIGLLLGPNNLPVAGVRVEVPVAGLSAKTDHKGKFRIPGFPVQLKNKIAFKLDNQTVMGDNKGSYWLVRYNPLEEKYAD